MSKELMNLDDTFSLDAMIDVLDEMRGNKEKREEFEEFYKSIVVRTSENILSGKIETLKKTIEESEVFSLIIKEKTKEFEEIAKGIYAMGRFEGAYDVFETWYKMYFDNLEYEKNMARVLNKKYVTEILCCIRKQPGIQNKMILEKVDIKPNYLSELTSEMIYYQIISRYRVGKNTFYELTPKAKEYFKKRKSREKCLKLKKYKMEMYIEFNEDKTTFPAEYRMPFLEEFKEYKDYNPTKLMEKYVLDVNNEHERSKYNV